MVIVEGVGPNRRDQRHPCGGAHLDDRRLIVPLNYFNTKPFQNWTWANSGTIGHGVFYVDYTFPVEAGREELKRILDGSDLWDGRAWVCKLRIPPIALVTLRA